MKSFVGFVTTVDSGVLGIYDMTEDDKKMMTMITVMDFKNIYKCVLHVFLTCSPYEIHGIKKFNV